MRDHISWFETRITNFALFMSSTKVELGVSKHLSHIVMDTRVKALELCLI